VTRQPPPASFSGTPNQTTLAAGTVLSRVHRTQYGSREFNPHGSDILWGGGRFDSTEKDRYPFLYAGQTDDVAVAEALLRDIDADDHGSRFLAKKYWRGRQLSRLRTTEDVRLVSLRTGKDLGAIGQDTWLTTCNAQEYAFTREWAQWLRTQAADAAGLVWHSKREPGQQSLVLFEDRCPGGLLEDAPGPLATDCVFDQEVGFQWLRTTLAQYRVGIRRSRRGIA
jgi:RES domain